MSDGGKQFTAAIATDRLLFSFFQAEGTVYKDACLTAPDNHNATCAARLTLTCKGWNGTTHTRSAGGPQLSTTHVPEAHTGACTFVRVAHTHHRWRVSRASGFERNAA